MKAVGRGSAWISLFPIHLRPPTKSTVSCLIEQMRKTSARTSGGFGPGEVSASMLVLVIIALSGSLRHTLSLRS